MTSSVLGIPPPPFHLGTVRKLSQNSYGGAQSAFPWCDGRCDRGGGGSSIPKKCDVISEWSLKTLKHTSDTQFMFQNGCDSPPLPTWMTSDCSATLSPSRSGGLTLCLLYFRTPPPPPPPPGHPKTPLGCAHKSCFDFHEILVAGVFSGKESEYRGRLVEKSSQHPARDPGEPDFPP